MNRNTAAAAIAILLFASVGLSCSLLPPTRPLTWNLTLEIDAAAADKDATVKRTVLVIERRLDGLGLQSKVVAQGTPPSGRITVSLADVPDHERVKRVLTAGGVLELAAVVSPPSPSPVQTYDTRAEAVASLGDEPAANRRVLPYNERSDPNRNDRNSRNSRQPETGVVVGAPAIVDGSELRSAAAVQSYAGSDAYLIHFSLGQDGAYKFGTWTGSHINDYLSVVLNGEVKSIAFIKSQITDTGEISGNFTKQSAEDLALVLRSGALPVPVKIVEESANK